MLGARLQVFIYTCKRDMALDKYHDLAAGSVLPQEHGTSRLVTVLSFVPSLTSPGVKK